MKHRRCVYCGVETDGLHRDHIIPHSRGGGDDAHNCLMACRDCNLSKADRTPSEWRPSGLDQWIYDLEKKLAHKYRMTARGSRPKTTEAEAIELPCDICGYNLAEDPHRGWVSWWAKYENGHLGPVQEFHVTCAGTMNDRCTGVIDRRYERRHGSTLTCFDHHLHVFLGKRAMWRMQTLLWNYDWIRQSKAHNRMLDFFTIAQRIPETERTEEAYRLTVEFCL